MALDVFTQKLGGEKMPRLDADNTGLIAVQMLDAIQTVVDVLTDNDGGKGYTVSYDPGLNAYTDRSAKRRIVVSVKPLLDAKPGDSLADIAAVMTGFAVHEVGHTKLNFYTAIAKRWPGAQLPKVLGNIIEDVVLELRTVERFPGFADHGEGNVFRPTLKWVADKTCPKSPLKWAGSTGHKVNVVGQIIRYREFVTFGADTATQDALTWVETWAQGITPNLTPSGCVALIADLLAYMKASVADEEEPEGQPTEGEDGEPEPGEGNGEGEGGSDQRIPDEDDDDDDTEGDSGGDGDGDEDDDESDTEGGSPGEGLDDSDDGEAGDGEADGESDEDGDGEAEDGGEGEGEGDGPGKGDGNDADTMDRGEADKGTNDSEGKGGSGQSIAEAMDEGDVDEGFDEADLDDTFDEVSKPEGYDQRRINDAEQDERVTTRVDAGAFGKMRVIFR